MVGQLLAVRIALMFETLLSEQTLDVDFDVMKELDCLGNMSTGFLGSVIKFSIVICSQNI